MFKKTTLKNGLKIITVPQKDTQAVTVLVLVGTGSKYEKKEINGISHFLEHILFKGTKKRPTPIEVSETLDKVGGLYNAFTGEEYTGYFAKVSANHLNLALDWVSDIFLNSKLDKEGIKREKGVIIEEINMYYDNPMSYVQILWKELLYGDQPAGWSIAGSKKVVLGITREKLESYMKSQYTASNTIVCLSGRINGSRAAKDVEKYFSQTKKGRAFSKKEVIEKQKKPALLLKTKKTDQTHLCLGVRSYNLFHKNRFAQEILAVILGGMMSSRLFIEVREKLGLAYYIKTESSADPDTGFLVTQAGVDNKNAEKAIATILKEYKKISLEKIPPQELKKAKDYIKGKMSLGLESSDAKASFYGVQELLEGRILTPAEIYDKIDKITAEDILMVCKDIFQPQKLNLALIGPFGDKKRFQKLLKI